MPVIKNVSRTAFVLNGLQGEDYGDSKPTTTVHPRFVVLPDGTGGMADVEVTHPPVWTWLPGETLAVPEAVGKVPEFRRAVLEGTLRVVPLEKAPPAPVEDAALSGEGNHR
jgi:hypothetical protein